MRNYRFILITAVIIVIVAVIARKSFIGNGITKPPEDVSGNSGQSVRYDDPVKDIQLKTFSGFSISYFAKGLVGPRVMIEDSSGNIITSLTQAGKVAVISYDGKKMKILLQGLKQPHGLLIIDIGGKHKLYVAETDMVIRYDYDPAKQSVSNPQKLAELSGGGRHSTRTLLLLPDGRILISVGSSCDSCVEKDKTRGSILVMNQDGSGLKSFATGLRNSVFLIYDEVNKRVLATDMGRDFLGDNLPPDEVNIIKDGGFYGWPYCYGNKIQDKRIDATDKGKKICSLSVPPFIQIPAHSATLGIVIFPSDPSFSGSLLVAYHGSWNRSIPTGYKIVMMKIGKDGSYQGTTDFITGWIAGRTVSGRPAGLLFLKNGNLLISDDKRGVIYMVSKLK